MSWQSWIDNLLAYEPINVAAIYGLDGSVWAKSASCTASDAEIQALLRGLNASNAGDFSSFTFQGVKFITLRASEGDIDGKASYQAISVAKANKCFVVAAFMNSNVDAKAVNEKVKVAVHNLRQSLKKSDY